MSDQRKYPCTLFHNFRCYCSYLRYLKIREASLLRHRSGVWSRRRWPHHGVVQFDRGHLKGFKFVRNWHWSLKGSLTYKIWQWIKLPFHCISLHFYLWLHSADHFRIRRIFFNVRLLSEKNLSRLTLWRVSIIVYFSASIRSLRTNAH